MAQKQERHPRLVNRRRRLDERLLASLLGDFVDPVPGGVLRRLDLLSTLAAKNAHKAADRVFLPTRRLNDLGQRRALSGASS